MAPRLAARRRRTQNGNDGDIICDEDERKKNDAFDVYVWLSGVSDLRMILAGDSALVAHVVRLAIRLTVANRL